MGSNILEVWFDQDVDSISAEDPGNYKITPLDGGHSVSVIGANMVRGYDRLQIQTSNHQFEKKYQISITGVKDKYHPATTINSSGKYIVYENLLKNPEAEHGLEDWQSFGGFMTENERENQLPYMGSSFFTGQDLESCRLVHRKLT